jgi:hypothetical protein
MQLYDILYVFEIYSLLLSWLNIAGDSVSIEDVSLTTLSVTLLLLYFFSNTRSRSQAFAENVFGSMLLAIIACIICVFLLAHMRFCGSQQSASVMTRMQHLFFASFRHRRDRTGLAAAFQLEV